uniref:Uncharacterized protein n=1 Tax=Cacopsylla melanoneura TaxID=428564 RepID=A0A8D8W6B1_9HEMI
MIITDNGIRKQGTWLQCILYQMSPHQRLMQTSLYIIGCLVVLIERRLSSECQCTVNLSLWPIKIKMGSTLKRTEVLKQVKILALEDSWLTTKSVKRFKRMDGKLCGIGRRG